MATDDLGRETYFITKVLQVRAQRRSMRNKEKALLRL